MDAGLVGRILLYAAIATSVWGAAASLLGKHRADARLAVSGRRGLYATTGLLVAATLWLVAALLRHDFSILYVAQVTSRSTPFPYPLTALWAGMAGSLRFWTLLTSLYASSAIAVRAPRRPELVGVATLLPWLTATAFLHSVMIQERRGMLKIWNVALILSTYSLAVLGTFLTRSGLLSSVHTFSESPVGKYFLPFLAVLVIGSFALLGFRLDRLRSQRHLDAAVSRESMFLFNNLVFVAIAFTVLWGTLYPVVVEAVTGQQVSVGPPYFNAVVVPLGLALLGLMGIGPLVAWRRASSRGLRRAFTLPLAAGVVTIVALFAAGLRSAGAALAFALCAFVTVTIVSEFTRWTP